MSTILRAFGKEFDVDAFRAGTTIPIDSYGRRGESRTPSSPKREHSYVSILASDADFCEFPRQVTEATEFLRNYAEQIRKLREFPGVEEVTLDFGIELRDVAVHCDQLPAEFLLMAGSLGVNIELSHYPIAEETLYWLIGHRFQSIIKREHDWVIAFDQQAYITIACLWRLIEDGRIRVASPDDGHKFGLPAPVDAVAQVITRLLNCAVTNVELRKGTLDLRIVFDKEHFIEIIPDSSGYESWIVHRPQQQFVATGGGELVSFDE